MARAQTCVTVTINGNSMVVPVRTKTAHETLAALGLGPQTRIALDHAAHLPLDISNGWGFAEGQRYVTVVGEGEPNEEPRAAWQLDPDYWKA